MLLFWNQNAIWRRKSYITAIFLVVWVVMWGICNCTEKLRVRNISLLQTLQGSSGAHRAFFRKSTLQLGINRPPLTFIWHRVQCLVLFSLCILMTLYVIKHWDNFTDELHLTEKNSDQVIISYEKHILEHPVPAPFQHFSGRHAALNVTWLLISHVAQSQIQNISLPSFYFHILSLRNHK
jgi:hypothetical protein